MQISDDSISHTKDELAWAIQVCNYSANFPVFNQVTGFPLFGIKTYCERHSIVEIVYSTTTCLFTCLFINRVTHKSERRAIIIRAC